MNDFFPLLQDAMVTIGGAVITLLAAFAVRAINSYTIKLQVEADNLIGEDAQRLAEAAIARVNSLATTTVTAIEQTTAKTLREAVKNGNAKPEELKRLSLEALWAIQENLAPEYLAAISDIYGDSKKYILNVIEQKVWELKNAPLVATLEKV